jgi:hypothetical protein
VHRVAIVDHHRISPAIYPQSMAAPKLKNDHSSSTLPTPEFILRGHAAQINTISFSPLRDLLISGYGQSSFPSVIRGIGFVADFSEFFFEKAMLTVMWRSGACALFVPSSSGKRIELAF